MASCSSIHGFSYTASLSFLPFSAHSPGQRGGEDETTLIYSVLYTLNEGHFGFWNMTVKIESPEILGTFQNPLESNRNESK